MPNLNGINTSKINSLIAFLADKALKTAYLRQLKEPQIRDATYHQLQHELQDERNIQRVCDEYTKWKQRGISLVSIEEEIYPEKLKNIPNPPILLFIRGNVENLRMLNQSLAIVGSRSADIFGCELAGKYAEYAALKNICVISGLALGIDTHAHKGALKSGRKFSTIAVLGNGLDRIYPTRNSKLADEIIENGGLILSHFAPSEAPFPHNFLDRNRIISGLSDATLVIQAPQRSGALSTASHALEQGRDLLVVPGAVNDSKFTGSNRLIKNGAGVMCEERDLMDYFTGSPQIEINEENYCDFGGIKGGIMSLLNKRKRIHLEELSSIASDSSELAVSILELEMLGLLKQEPGNFVSITA